MTDNFGIHAATSSSWERELNIRPFVKELQESHPQAGFSELWRRFSQMMLDDSDARDAAAYYVMKNCWQAQHGYATRAEEQQRGEQVQQKVAKRLKTPQEKAMDAVAVESAKEQLRYVYRLDAVMPNGKTLRNCNADDLRSFGDDFNKMAKHIGDRNVGDTFQDDKSLGDFANH